MSNHRFTSGLLFRSAIIAFAIIGLGVVWSAGWLPIEQKPYFFEVDGIRRLNCYGGPGTHPSNPLALEFTDQGYVAVLQSSQTQLRLKYTPGNLFSSVWKDGKVELTMDPEIYISGLEDHEIGPCERI
ncbi:hypothetical protein [Microvirga rosea]|uniref:hypothetical protein n=1 Tax=Microvirga rosea TaxID=2715425 RepID=UPI001D09CAF9|nr:hypothetical protein [Microvirga rosea]MCB8820748.1 hypothetical protein [Microvirga rosea]